MGGRDLLKTIGWVLAWIGYPTVAALMGGAIVKAHTSVPFGWLVVGSILIGIVISLIAFVVVRSAAIRVADVVLDLALHLFGSELLNVFTANQAHYENQWWTGQDPISAPTKDLGFRPLGFRLSMDQPSRHNFGFYPLKRTPITLDWTGVRITVDLSDNRLVVTEEPGTKRGASLKIKVIGLQSTSESGLMGAFFGEPLANRAWRSATRDHTLSALDAKDAVGIGENLADDCVLGFGKLELHGKVEIEQKISDLFGSMKSLHHDLITTILSPRASVVECDVRYELDDGAVVTTRAVALYTESREGIHQCRLYLS